MASDEIVWQIINQQFCAFKIKTTKGQNFCRNEYNVTGLCNRMSCPLANSRYATVRQENGVLYLYMKTIERAHMPSKLWERIKLSEDYARSLEQIDERLLYWPKYLSHKCKQRMTRLAQVALRSRRLAKEDERMGETIVGKAAPKVKRREATRERKALAAAKLEKQIEKELIERLRSGAYGEAPLNVEEGIWKKVLRGLERGGDAERDVDEEEEMEGELEDEEDYDEDEEIEYVSGDEELEEEAENDLNDIEEWIGSGASDFEDDDDEADSSDEESDDEEEAPKSKKGPVAPVDPKKRKRDAPAPKSRKRGARVEIEYEEERALPSAKDLAF